MVYIFEKFLRNFLVKGLLTNESLETEYKKRLTELTTSGWDNNKYQEILNWYQDQKLKQTQPDVKGNVIGHPCQIFTSKTTGYYCYGNGKNQTIDNFWMEYSQVP
jgi:hypothetical protein